MLLLAVRLASVVSPSPSPSIPANPYLEAVEEWPDPPSWMFVAVKVLAVVVGLVVLVTVAAALGTWRTKRSEASQRPRPEWVDLSGLGARTSGVDRANPPSGPSDADELDEPDEPRETGSTGR